MRTFSIHQVRNVLIAIAVVVLIGATYLANSTPLRAPSAEAGTSQNINGWAWSDAVGWISLNSLTCDTDNNGFIDSGTCGGDNTTTVSSNYGVNVDTTQKVSGGLGNFSGYAWNDNIGWISFNRSDAGNPPAAPFNGGSGPIAQIDWSTGAIKGWARVLSTNGGWDGWIKLAKDPADAGTSYGIAISGNKFVGYAWWSDVSGWIDFAPTVDGQPVAPPEVGEPCVVSGYGDPAATWGSCQAAATCEDATHPAGATYYDEPAVAVGVCIVGGGTTVQSCPDPVTLICPAAPAPGATKTHWWQF